MNDAETHSRETADDARERRARRSSQKRDVVAVSERARLLKQADAAVRASKDVRTDRVERLKKKVRTNTYEVDAERIAERLLESDKNP
ncbi:MAG TPA: flagellar biosynthesis anti-sigma factor FlgM [Dehalococcoidia bacterium]|nr:flagellar biosynthesis anti-sigma factor FlgM [Dehalococcoidia bacterium]